MTRRVRTSVSMLFCIMAVAVTSSSVLAAGRPPNLKGKWIGKTYTIVAGMGGHWPTNKGTLKSPAW